MPLLLAALIACSSGPDPLLPLNGEPIRLESPQPSLELGKTDVLLVMVDTLRADRLGAWGNPHRLSPNIDTLATAGVRFSLGLRLVPSKIPLRHAVLSRLRT